MKRLFSVLAVVLATGLPAFAQILGGSVSGTIKDEQGGVLPGVTVTAQGVDATQTFVTEATGEYRFLNLAPGPYRVTATLPGFTTFVRDNVIVSVGKSVDLPMQLKIAQVAETITVSGESPVIDTKATGTSTNFTSDELTKIPTSRDPFALMRSVPGVLVDRVNIGGNETGRVHFAPQRHIQFWRRRTRRRHRLPKAAPFHSPRDINDVFALRHFEDGQVVIPVASCHHLAHAAQALAEATGGHAAGAIVLTL